jgi:hypothetical protein
MSDNMNLDAVRASLKRAPWRKVAEVEVEGEAGATCLLVRRPPNERMMALHRDWRERGLLGENGETPTPENGAQMGRELLALVLFLPNAPKQLFTQEELVEVAWVDEVLPKVMAAISPAKGVEDAKGNSSATQA